MQSKLTRESKAPIHKNRLRNSHWPSFAICFLLVAAIWGVFGQTLHYEFVNCDDNAYVYQNPAVTAGLTWRGVVLAFHDGGPGTWDWVPLTTISHMADCQWFGMNASGHHLMNVLLHTITGILLFLVLREMTGSIWRIAFVSMVFAIHPLRAESVAWVTERKDVLSGVFFMLTLWAYVRYVRHPGSLIRYLMVAFLFALGLMAKSSLVTLPFVLLILDYWPLNRLLPSPKGPGLEPVPCLKKLSLPGRLVIEKIPLLMLSAVSSVLTVLTQNHTQKYSLSVRMGNAVVSYVTYIWQMFCPSKLVAFYPYPANGWPLQEVILAAMPLAVISLGLFLCRRNHPYLLTGWLWYLGMLLPMIGLFQAGGQAHADRFTYLPQIGLYLLLTWLIADLSIRLRYRRWILGTAAATILTALMWDAYVQTTYWKNSVSLWTHALVYEESYFAEDSLGNALIGQNKLEDAIEHCKRAIELRPDFPDAYFNLGMALDKQGKASEATQCYITALNLNPDYPEASDKLGNILFNQGNPGKAIQLYEQALKCNPAFASAQVDWGTALAEEGELDAAIEHFETALKSDPASTQAQINWGIVLAKQGKLDTAIEHFKAALKCDSASAEAHVNLGIALAEKGEPDEAIEHFEMALKCDSASAQARLNWGITLANQGKVEAGIQQLNKALDLTTTQGDMALAESIRARIKYYRGASLQPHTP